MESLTVQLAFIILWQTYATEPDAKVGVGLS